MPVTQSYQTNSNSVQLTKDIISLGGAGVTLVEINNQITAVTYFDSKVNYDSDWIYIDGVIRNLSDFGAEYSRVVYVFGGNENIIEIKTQDYNDFISGKITNSQLQEKWILSGQLFQTNNTTNSQDSTNIGIANSSLYLYSNGKVKSFRSISEAERLRFI